MNNSTGTRRLLEEALYRHAIAPGDYDIPTELGIFMDWLESHSAPTRPTAQPGRTESPSRPLSMDLRVHHDAALDEIELYAEVLSAVAASDRPLTTEEIDAVLGVSHKDA